MRQRHPQPAEFWKAPTRPYLPEPNWKPGIGATGPPRHGPQPEPAAELTASRRERRARLDAARAMRRDSAEWDRHQIKRPFRPPHLACACGKTFEAEPAPRPDQRDRLTDAWRAHVVAARLEARRGG